MTRSFRVVPSLASFPKSENTGDRDAVVGGRFLVGVMQFGGAIFKLGFLINFLGHPVVSFFKTGVSFVSPYYTTRVYEGLRGFQRRKFYKKKKERAAVFRAQRCSPREEEEKAAFSLSSDGRISSTFPAADYWTIDRSNAL